MPSDAPPDSPPAELPPGSPFRPSPEQPRLGIIHLLMPTGTRTHTLAALTVLLLAIPVLAPGFMTRPHLFTYLYLVLLVCMLRSFFAGNDKSLALTPALMFFWVNSHGGVVAGLGIFAVITLIECVRGPWNKRLRILILCFSLSALATLFNPYGYKLWVFFYQTLGVARPIGEWGPVSLFDQSHLEYKILTLLFALTLLRKPGRDLCQVLVITAAIVYGFKHQRHTVLAVILMAPYLIQKLSDYFGTLATTQLTPVSHKLIHAVLGIFIVSQLYTGFQKYAYNHFDILVEPQVYPAYAVQFMQANEIKGNLLNPFDWGEYLIWHLPDSRVSIDGRFRTAYPEADIEKNLNFSYGGGNWKEMLDSAQLVLTRQADQTHQRMDTLTDWQKIYEDPISILYIPKTDPPSELLQRYIYKELIRPDTPPSYRFP